jgi:predicted RNA-binding protein (virulence factor B family)
MKTKFFISLFILLCADLAQGQLNKNKSSREQLLEKVLVNGCELLNSDYPYTSDRVLIQAAIKSGCDEVYWEADDSLRLDPIIAEAFVSINFRNFFNIHHWFKSNKSVIKSAVKKNVYSFEVIDEKLKSNKKFILELLNTTPEVFRFLCNSLKQDRLFVMDALEVNSGVFRYLNASFKIDKAIVLLAMKNGVGREFEFADQTLKNDKEFIMELIPLYPYVAEFIDESLKKDKEVVFSLMSGNFFNHHFDRDDSIYKIFPTNVFDNKDFVLELLKVKSRYTLAASCQNLRKDRAFVLEVLKNNPLDLRYVDKSLLFDKELVLTAVSLNGNSLEYADEILKKDKEVVLSAVSNSGGALQFADKELKKDRQIVMQAVNKDGNVLQYADPIFWKDREIVMTAINGSAYALEYADISLRKDREIVLKIANSYEGRAIMFAADDLKKDRELVLQAIKSDPSAFDFIDSSLKRDKNILSEVLSSVFWSDAVMYVDNKLKNDREFVRNILLKNGNFFQFISPELKKDKELILLTLSSDFINDNVLFDLFNNLDSKLKSDREILTFGLKRNVNVLYYADESFKKDKKLMSYLISKLSLNLFSSPYFLYDLKNDPEFILGLIEDSRIFFDEKSFDYVGDSLKGDRAFMLRAVTINGQLLKYASNDLKSDKTLISTALKSWYLAIQYGDSSIRNDRDLVVKSLETYYINKFPNNYEMNDFYYLMYQFNREFRNDKSVYLEALNKNFNRNSILNKIKAFSNDQDFIRKNNLENLISHPYSFEYLDSMYKKDDEFMNIAVNSGIYDLSFASDKYTKNREIVLQAVKYNGNNIAFTSELFQNDKEIVMAAVSNVGSAFLYASNQLKTDKEIILVALKNDITILDYVDKSLFSDSSFVREIISINGELISYFDEKLMHDRNIILDAVTSNGRALKYADDDLKKDPEIVSRAIDNCFYGDFVLQYADKRFLKDKSIVMKIIDKESAIVVYDSIDEVLKNDKDILLALFKKDFLIHDIFKKINNANRKDRNLALSSLSDNFYSFPSSYHFFDESLKHDKMFMINVLEIAPEIIYLMNQTLLNSKEFIVELLDLCKKDRNKYAVIIDFIKSCDESLWEDRDLAINLVCADGICYNLLNDNLKGDIDIKIAALNSNGLAIKYMDENDRSNRHLLMIAISNNVEALKYADASLRKDIDLIKIALDSSMNAFQYVDTILKSDKEFLLEILKSRDGYLCDELFKYIDPILKKDKVFVKLFFASNSSSLFYADDKLKDDQDFITELMEINSYAFDFSSDRLKDKNSFVRNVIKKYPNLIYNASPRLQKKYAKESRSF